MAETRPAQKYSAAYTLYFDIHEVDGVDIDIDGPFAVGDIVISKDGGAEISVTNTPVDEGSSWSLILTATEMQAAQIAITMIDQTATKAWLDKTILIETYGNASAQHAFDLDTALVTLAATTHTGAVIPTVSTLTGHTPQTGDSYTRIGATGSGLTSLASQTSLDTVDTNVDTLITNVPDVISLANINAEVDTGLADYDGPTNAEMVARTLLAADYFDPAADTVANVTTVATLTGHTAQTGDSFARIGATGSGLTSLASQSSVDTVDSNVDTLNTNVPDVISLANINAEVDTALSDIALDHVAIRQGTAQAGSTSTTIVLDAGASASNNWYNGGIVQIVGGTGTDQVRTVRSYTGSSKTATVGTWQTVPDATSVFVIWAGPDYVNSNLLTIDSASSTGLQTMSSDYSGSGWIDANVMALSDDSTAANNLESDYDGTGYTKTNSTVGTVTDITNLHASAATSANQTTILNRIGAFTGAGVNTILGFFQTLARSDGSTPSDMGGTYDNTTDSLQATRDHVGDGTNLTEAGGTGDHLSAIPAVASVTGTVSADVVSISGDSVAADNAEAFFDGTGYAGTNNVIPTVTDVTNLHASAATAASISGLNDFDPATQAVEIATTQTTATDGSNAEELVDFVWDEELTGATHNVSQSSGKRLRDVAEVGVYGGAIWIDTVNGSAGTTDYINGTDTNPVSTIADANTLATSLGISRFNIAPNSSITFAASQQNQNFAGTNWTLALGGQNIDGTAIVGATVSGVGTNSSGFQSFEKCLFNATTIPSNTTLRDSAFGGTLTLGEAGDYYIDNCFSTVAGSGTPTLDFGGGLSASSVSFRHYSGGIEVQNMGAGAGTYNMSLEGNGQLVINANCSATSNISIRGHFTVTDNAGGAVTLSDNARYDVAQINAEADAALSDIHLNYLFAADYDPASKPGTATALLNELVEADAGVSRFTQNALEQAPGGSSSLPSLLQTTTIATLTSQTVFTLTDGSPDDDAYNNQIVIVTDQTTGTQKAVGICLDYIGSTKELTLTADPGIFTMAVNDNVDIVATSPAGSAPSAAQVADAVWDEPRSGHVSAGSFGGGVLVEDLNTAAKSSVNAEVDTGLSDIHLNYLLATDYDPASKPGTATALLNELIESDGGVSRFTQNALEQAPGGGSITQILNVQPMLPAEIDLADTATVRLGLALINSVDDLPSTAEITPGTISIERKAIGGTSWSAVVTDAAMSESAGQVYYDEVFDSGSGYAEGDSIRVTFKSVSITADTNTHEICDANGIMFQISIRQTMRGTDGANTTTPLTAVQVKAEADQALADYDGPTNAEMEARTLLSAQYFDPISDFVAAGVTTSIISTNAVTADALDVSAVEEIADYVWNELRAGHVTVGSFGETQNTVETNIGNLDTTVSSRSSHSAADVRTEMDSNSTELAKIGTVGDLGSGATLGDNLTDMAGATFSSATDSQEAIRDRGDVAWITGGGGGITQSMNVQVVVPTSIDLANTATVRLGVMLFNALDDLPTIGEIDPGTISIDRKAMGGTSWSAVVTDAAMSESAGFAYYDEVFDSGSGYAEGDSIRVTFKSITITADANDHEIVGATGIGFQTFIRQTERGTDSAYTGTPPTVAAIRQEIDSNSAELANIKSDTNELQTDWANGGRLDQILDARASQASVDALNDLSAAQVNAEVDSAIETYNLDKLLAAAVSGTDVTNNSVFAKLVASGVTADWDTFVNTTDSLQAIRDSVALESSISALNDPSAVEIRTEMDSNSTKLSNIEFDVNDLQTDWQDGGRLDLILDELTVQGDTNESKIDTVDANVDLILTDTSTTIPNQISGLNNLSAAEVNAEVLDVLATDLFAEPSGVPSATASLEQKLSFLYMALRNQIDVTSTKKTYYDDAGNPEWEKDLTHLAGTYSESEANAI